MGRQFFARVGDNSHQSALLLTSRELPPELARLERRGAPVRRLPLPGLSFAAGQRLLTAEGLNGTVEQQRELLHRYSGNPLALQLVGKTIQDFFAGAIAAFLSDETLFFDDVREVLDQQFARLTSLERELLLWLAIEREPVPLPLLQGELLYAGPKSAVVEALLDLQQRTLLEKTPTGFTLQNVIMEYATAYLVDAICQEIETATPHLLHSHALLKAQAKEYIRQSQARLLLQPIRERLQKKLGIAGIETKFKVLLDQVRQGDAARATYTDGNILNLLLYLGMNPSSYDFSQMAVWQADLSKADLQTMNLAQADLRNTLFAQNFSACHTLAFSPDGELLAGGMANGEIHLWRTVNHQLDTIIKAHETIIWDLVFSPDGQWLASGSKDGSIRLWNVQTHQCQHTFTGHTDWVRAVAFHPAGRLLASGGHDQTVRLWDVSSGRTLHVLDNHTGWVMGLAFSPDGKRLVSASTDHTVRLWDLQTGQEEIVLRGHSACTESLCFSPDGTILASASYDQTICLWDLSTPVEPDSHPLLRVLQGHKGAIYGAAFSADGRRIFCAGHEEMIYVWDVENGQRLFMIPGPGREVNALAVHPAGTVLATSETGASALCLWEIGAKPTLSHIFYGYQNWANDVAFHPHLPLVASASPAEKVYLWDALTGQHLQGFRCENGMGTSVAIGSQPNGEGAQLAFGSMDHSAWLWPNQQQSSAVPRQRAAPLVLHTPGEVHSVAFSTDGRQVITSGYDGAVHL
jgi:WD40 repeat protein